MSDVRPFRRRSSSFAALIATLLVAGCITFELSPTIPPWSATYVLEPELVAQIETYEYDPGPQIYRLTLVDGERLEFSIAERRRLPAAPGHRELTSLGETRDLVILGTGDEGPWHLFLRRSRHEPTCWALNGTTWYAGREPGGPAGNWIIVDGYRFPLAAGLDNRSGTELRPEGNGFPEYGVEVCLNADLEVAMIY